MSSPVSGSTTAGSTTGSSSDGMSSLTGSTDPLANEETFLQLLVSQLQNQDPLDPTDSNQFVSQLTSYSQLEQLIDIHNDADSVVSDLGATPSTGSSTGAAAGSSSTNPATNTSATTNSTTTNSTGN